MIEPHLQATLPELHAPARFAAAVAALQGLTSELG